MRIKKILPLTSYSKQHVNVVSKNDNKTIKNDRRTIDIRRPSGQRPNNTNKKQCTMQQTKTESTKDLIDLNKAKRDRSMIVHVKQYDRFLIHLV